MADKPASPFEHLPRRVLFADVAAPEARAARPKVTTALKAKVESVTKTPTVTKNTVTKNRGRPKKADAQSQAERAKAYRERKAKPSR
jgi:hypothetical protein